MGEFKDVALSNVGSPLNISDSNSVALGKVIYTDYFFIFQAAGIILLIAMIGSIVLTLRKRPDVKRQNVIEQIYRSPNNSIEVIDVKPGRVFRWCLGVLSFSIRYTIGNWCIWYFFE